MERPQIAQEKAGTPPLALFLGTGYSHRSYGNNFFYCEPGFFSYPARTVMYHLFWAMVSVQYPLIVLIGAPFGYPRVQLFYFLVFSQVLLGAEVLRRGVDGSRALRVHGRGRPCRPVTRRTRKHRNAASDRRG